MIKKFLLISTLLINGCMTPTVQHPGALNSFDNFAYDSLLVEQAALNQAKMEVVQFPAIKTQLNNAILQYDTTMLAYKAYHIALTQGQNPSQTELQTAINNLITQIAMIVKGMTK